MAKNNSAERAKKKPNAEGGKGGKRSHRRADLREKFAVEHQRGGNAIEKKIVPVDHRAGKTTRAARRARCSESGASPGCTLIVESIPCPVSHVLHCYWNETLLPLRLL